MTQNYPDIYVLRHGQTEWNAAGRFQGRMGSPLTELGISQAGEQNASLEACLKGRAVTAFCSPQERAARTADIALKGITSPVIKDDRLCEVSFGDWEGRTAAEIEHGWPDLFRMQDDNPFAWHFSSPGGERFAEMTARCQSFLNDLQGPSVIVTHGITSRVLRGLWLGLDETGMAALPGGQGCVYAHIQEQ